jgi:hypothetical protein
MDGVGLFSNGRYDTSLFRSITADIAVVKFVLIHDQKNDDGIRMFFNDLWELWVKVS